MITHSVTVGYMLSSRPPGHVGPSRKIVLGFERRNLCNSEDEEGREPKGKWQNPPVLEETRLPENTFLAFLTGRVDKNGSECTEEGGGVDRAKSQLRRASKYML